MPKEEEIAYEIQRVQLVVDNPTTHGHTLEDIHRSLCLIDARRAVATNGFEEFHMDSFLSYIRLAFKTRENNHTNSNDIWVSFVHSALENAQQLREIFKES